MNKGSINSSSEGSSSVGEAKVSLVDIYNLLFAGKNLQLNFPTKNEAENFRIRLHQYKTRQDRAQVAIGMIAEAELQRLVFRYEEGTGIARMKFEDKPDPRQYVIKVIDDEPTASDE